MDLGHPTSITLPEASVKVYSSYMPARIVRAPGAVDGVIKLGRSGSVAFCDVCQFASAAGKQIESMKSYAVEIKTEA